MALKDERVQIDGIVDRLLDNLSGTITGAKGADVLRQKIGLLRSTYLQDLIDGYFADHLSECFDLAFDQTPPVARVVVIRNQLFIETATGPIAQQIVAGAIVMALALESKLISAIEFTSRDDVEAMILSVRTAFDTARDLDIYDVATFRALTSLMSSLTNHLAVTARPLPQMVTFSPGIALPALLLSNRFYRDPKRYLELIRENKIAHPLFCPKEIRGLSR